MIDFPRYLAAKKTVDDRALNRFVWQQLRSALSAQTHNHPLRVLELGCGIGTMVERLLEWGLATNVIYLGIDSQVENIRVAENRLKEWGQTNGFQIGIGAQVISVGKGEIFWQVGFQQADVTSFQTEPGFYDLLIANAFLDLIDVPRLLPLFSRLMAPDGLFYFTINFDGETIFEPVFGEALETKIIRLYHQSMDDRLVDDQPSGDSRTGRHLFTHLRAADAQILAAGASDWIVYPGPNGYPADEAYFLSCILDFFESALKSHPDLPQGELERWLTKRRRQIDGSELTYIAHQLDFLGTFTH
jgi:SAM-dependent methyltransferase